MIPYFGVGDAGTALRLLKGRAMMVSHAYVGTNFIRIGRVKGEEINEFELLLNACSRMRVDSGAFTAFKKGEPLTDAQIHAYIAFVEKYKHRLDGAINVDTIGDAEASLRRWKYWQEQGVDLIPVWHEGDPLEHLHEYNPNKRLVALGRIAGRNSKRLTLEFYAHFFNAYPYGRAHALGNMDPNTVELVPVEACDAVTWQMNAMYADNVVYPYSRCSKETRMIAGIEAGETLRYMGPVAQTTSQLRLAL